MLTRLPLGSRVSPASAQVPLKLFEHFPQVSKAKLVKSLSQLIKENAICISAPCFLGKPAEALSCESELLRRSLAYSHHGNSLQCTTERVKEKSQKLTRGAQEKATFTERDFSLNYWVATLGSALYRIHFFRKSCSRSIFWVKFCNFILNTQVEFPIFRTPL